jgi:hypothetical protein
MKRRFHEAATSSARAESQGLALRVKGNSLLLYDPKGMTQALQVLDPEQQSFIEMDKNLSDHVFGFLEVINPVQPSWGAKIVRSASAQKGYGPLMYDIAMTLFGKIAPDRAQTSPAAENIWKYYNTQRPDIQKQKFDDVTAPKTPSKEDDAQIYPDRDPALNQAYSGASVGVENLKSNHERFVHEAEKIITKSDAGTSVEDWLETAADAFFRKMY